MVKIVIIVRLVRSCVILVIIVTKVIMGLMLQDVIEDRRCVFKKWDIYPKVNIT